MCLREGKPKWGPPVLVSWREWEVKYYYIDFTTIRMDNQRLWATLCWYIQQLRWDGQIPRETETIEFT